MARYAHFYLRATWQSIKALLRGLTYCRTKMEWIAASNGILSNTSRRDLTAVLLAKTIWKVAVGVSQ